MSGKVSAERQERISPLLEAMMPATSVSVHKNDAKTAHVAGERLPLDGETTVGDSSPLVPALDLDMEELSGSLLVEEPPARAALFSAGFAPAAGTASRSVAPRAPLPVVVSPPPHLPSTIGPQPGPAPAVDPGAAADNLKTVDLSDLAVTTIQQPAPHGLLLLAPTSPLVDDVELTTLPRPVLAPILSAFKSGLRRASSLLPPRDSPRGGPSKRGLPIVALSALIVVVSLVVLAVTAVRPDDGGNRPPPSTAAVILPTAAAPTAWPAAPGAALGACTLSGEPQVVAPSAVVGAGIETRALGGDVALGFAQSEHQAIIVRLDPSSLSVAESTMARSKNPILRVTPIPGKKGRLGVAIDADRKGDALRGRRTVPIDPPLQLGVAEGHIAWAPLNRGVAGKLWPLDGDDPVEALRGARSESNLSTVAIAFRRSGAVWVGTAEGTSVLVPKGDLSRVAGLGQVGSPTIAVNEGVVLVAWADRASPEAPWRLRWVRFKAGEAPGAPSEFATPAGGKGEQAMSPGLAVIPGGRFLLVWTEGPASSHEVRALTLSGEGTPIGAPLGISHESANAGQGQAAVSANGRGLVAFLRATAEGFQVAAAPIACPL